GHLRNGHSDLCLDPLDILSCCLRQILVLSDLSYIALPSRQTLQYRLSRDQLRGHRELVDDTLLRLVRYADGDLVQVTQHIQISQRDGSRALQPAAIAGRHRVEP